MTFDFTGGDGPFEYDNNTDCLTSVGAVSIPKPSFKPNNRIPGTVLCFPSHHSTTSAAECEEMREVRGRIGEWGLEVGAGELTAHGVGGCFSCRGQSTSCGVFRSTDCTNRIGKTRDRAQHDGQPNNGRNFQRKFSSARSRTLQRK